MPTRQMSPSISQTGSRRFTRALALAFNEWLLMLMLFANSIFSYVITKFADYYELQSPCLMCTRLDHILRRTEHLKKSHWDMVCSKHKTEISSLVYCHAHGKLVDVRGMCEACLFSFATTNKSNAETYRLLVGKLGEDSSFGSKSDPTNTNPRYCTCCNQLCMPLTSSSDQVLAKPVAMLPKIRLGGNMRTGKQSTTPKKSVRFNHLPHVGYTELKFHSDTESEAVFSEDEGVMVKEEDHRFQNVDLETPKVITLPYDLATDKLLNLEPLVARNDREEVHLQEINLRTFDSFFPEIIPANGVIETSEKVLKEEEIISLDDLFLTSRAMEQHSADVLKEKEDLIHFQDISLTPDFKETPADALMEETELIPVNGVSETSEKVLKKEEIISLDNLFLTSRAMEHSASVMKEKEDLIHLQDISLTPDASSTSVAAETPEDLFIGETVLQGEEELVHLQDTSLTPDFKEDSADALMEETELISLNDVTSTSVTEDILMGETVLHEKEELVQLQDTSLTPADALMEETELVCLNDVTSTSIAAETSEDILIEETVLQEKEELVQLQDTSLTPADALMEETELVCLNAVTSKSIESETPEDLLEEETVLQEKEELVHLQDTSLTPNSKENPAEALMEETKLTYLNDVTTSTSSDAAETPEDVLKRIEVMPRHDEVPESFTTNETPVETLKERDTNQDDTNSLESEYVVVSPSKSTKSMPEDSSENCVTDNKETKETSLTVSSVAEIASHTEAAPESESSSFNSMSVAAETNVGSGESWLQGGELLNLADAYNNIVHNEGSKDSNEGAHIEQWMKKDTSRVSEDLKALLTQISASRGIEFLSPRDISPKICTDQETKNLDLDMQLLIQKRMLERNESNLSLEGVSVSEIEGESESDRLKRQVDHDRRLLTGLYKELEEERSASAVATNQAMAMITRLQEEKALFQMEALQNLRMMEEQAEYDMEAIQKLNDLLVEREKLIQDLEAEIDYFRDQTPQKKNETKIDSPSVSNKIQNCLTGFNEERLYITSCLEKIENRVQTDGEAHVDDLETQESVSEVRERVEKLKGDMYFLEHVVNSLGHGNEGVQFVKEIASHLQTLRSLSMKRHNDTES